MAQSCLLGKAPPQQNQHENHRRNSRGHLSQSNCRSTDAFASADNGASIPPEAKTVSVTLFQNYASLAPASISQSFTEALRTKLSSQSRLTLIPKGGDLAFEGSITAYSTLPVAIQSTDQAAQTRLTVTVNVKYNCAFDEKRNFEQSFSRFADYPSNQSLTAVENRLIEEINDQLVQDIFNKALNNW